MPSRWAEADSKTTPLCFQHLFAACPTRGGPALQGQLRVLNRREDRDLRYKLDTLDRQYRCTRKMLQQRRDALMGERRRVGMVRTCEPKATVGVAMGDIGRHASAASHFRGVRSRGGRGPPSGESQCHSKEAAPAEQSRSVSAPPPPPNSSPRHRRSVHSSLSFVKMKNIAAIDAISEKELARRERQAREEEERRRRLQRERLHKRVTAFIEALEDKAQNRNV